MDQVTLREGVLAPEVTRDKLLAIEEGLRKVPGAFIGDSDNCPLTHTFADGVYVREIFIPKGTLVVGKIHKHSHPNFLLKGDVSVATEDGVSRIKAPSSMISKAGTKRVVFAHEDTVWVTVHVTDSQDLVKIEEEIIAKSYDELPSSITILLEDINGGEG